MKPIVWSIAGSDSGGGAGIQADLKTMNAIGVHGCTAVTAITAQSPRHVTAVEFVSPELVTKQLETLWPDLPPRAVKSGMIGDEKVFAAIIQFLEKNRPPYFVCDPVLVATSGASLTREDSLDSMKRLIALSDLVTPNLYESRSISRTEDVATAAAFFRTLSGKSVLIKGGHSGNDSCSDFYSSGAESFWLTSPRQNVQTHGTGCTLSSAIASYFATGLPEQDAVVAGKIYINRMLRDGKEFIASDMPVLTSDPTPKSYTFRECEKIGFYPIVPRAKLVERLVKAGVKSIQLRIKDLRGEELDREIAEASGWAREFGVQLFINDYWDLALKHDSFGVHLGQEDLITADMEKLSQHKIALGISTHSFSELARAHAYSPSYVALGPIFPTITKEMKFAPQGLETLRLWRKLTPFQLVAIGGIQFEQASDLLRAGADGISVVRDIVSTENIEERAQAWISQFRGQKLSL